MIELKDVNCSFSDRLTHKGRFTAVSSMTASFEDSSRYAIAGGSGSGKTTLARMIAGPQHPSTGAISAGGSLICGRTRAGREHFRKVQTIQQDSTSTLDPKLSIRWSTKEPLLCFFQTGKVQRRRQCRQFMELCNLPGDYYTRLLSELSDGEQKRAAIIRALAVEPQCLIFDKTTNGFDLPLRKRIIDEVIDLQHRLGFMLIFITHDMELAVVVADKIFVMRNSNLVGHTALSGDYSVSQNSYSRTLLEASGLTEALSDRSNKMKERIVLQ